MWSTVAHDHAPADLTPDAHAFLAERHLGTLSTLRADGSLHVCAVGFTWDPRRIRRAGDHRRRLAEGPQRRADRSCRGRAGRRRTVAVARRPGVAVTREPDAVAEAVARYAARYQEPRVNPERVAIEIQVERVLGRA